MAAAAPLGRHDFHVAIICALPLEADAIYAVLDKDWKDEGVYFGQAEGDDNTYTTGVIGDHNVVLVHLPGIGKVNAAGAAVGIRSSFPDIQLALVVGICGGVPFGKSPGDDIFLGDVIFSDSLIQYDFGRLYSEGLKRKNTVKDMLGRPSKRIQAIMAKLHSKSPREQMRKEATVYLNDIEAKLPESKYPGSVCDQIFDASYIHKHHAFEPGIDCDQCQAEPDAVCETALELTCDELGCDQSRLRRNTGQGRSSQKDSQFRVHIGTIGSGDLVIKSAKHQDLIAREDGVIAFEMEGAGVWDHFPTIVIKSACDYADSHKTKKWQRFAAATAAACTKAFLKSMVPSRFVVRSKETSTPVAWHVPLSNTQRLVGRVKEMEELQAKLFQSSMYSKVAVYGLGGIGKSRVAIELAYHTKVQRPEYSVLWVQATSSVTFETSYSEIGKLLQIPGIDQRGAEVVKLVKQYLSYETAGKWLMIIDNADDEAAWGRDAALKIKEDRLTDLIPQSRLGSVLVTTRNRRVAVHLAGPSVIKLSEVSQEEAIGILQTSLVNPGVLAETSAMAKLAEKLTYLPLAIVQAAAYMNMHDTSIEDYLKLLDGTEESLIEILSEDFNDEGRYPEAQNPIVSTWLISFKHMRSSDPHAADLLAYLSCFSEKDIPLSLFPRSPLGSSDKDMLERRGMLTGYSLIKKQINPDNSEVLYQMHRLVRVVTRNWLKTQGEFQRWVQAATKDLAKCFLWQRGGFATPCGLYLPHAEALVQSDANLDLKERYQLLTGIGCYLDSRGRYSDAVVLHKIAVQWFTSNLGPSARLALDASIALAYALRGCGQIQKAREVAEKTADLGSKVFDSNSHGWLRITRLLSSTYRKLHQFEQAEEFCLQALETCKELFGIHNKKTQRAKEALSLVYFKACEHNHSTEMRSKAERLVLEVLSERRKVLGELQPDTHYSLERLADIHMSYGRYDEVLELVLRIVQRNRELHGKEHPITLMSIADLAFAYYKLGRFMEAEDLLLETLGVRTRVLGFDHPSTIRLMAAIASTWIEQDRLDEACAMMKRCIMLSITRLGADHFRTQKYITDWAERVGYNMIDNTWMQTSSITDDASEKVDRLLSGLAQQSSQVVEIPLTTASVRKRSDQINVSEENRGVVATTKRRKTHGNVHDDVHDQEMSS